MISIIVPIYNIEKYLAHCIDSVLNSTLTDFELILVDDGSTDSSGSICDEYSTWDERISVIHQENGGISIARNHGLEKAHGDYVIFIDGDDVIKPEMLETMLQALDSSDSDLAMVRAYTIDEDGIVTTPAVDEQRDTRIITQEDYMRFLYERNEFGYPVVWNKLYRRQLIEGMTFASVAAEDIEWTTRVTMRVKKISLIERQLYGYRIRSTSVTREAKGVNPAIANRLDTYLKCLDEIPATCRKYRSWCLLYTYKYLLTTRLQFRGTSLYNQVKAKARNIYKQTAQELLHSDLGFPKKWALLCFYHVPALYAPIYSAHAKKCASQFEREGYKQS